MNGMNQGYEYEHGGTTVRAAVHCAGVVREPMVQWQVDDHGGDHGYVQLDAEVPVIRLEEGEIARLDGEMVSAIPVPRDIGEALKCSYEELGTVVPDDDEIGSDPEAFPVEVASFDLVGWEAGRNVMWYGREDRHSPRAYQIESGGLVFRAQEWVDGLMSKQDLIEKFGLVEPQF
jgi:hypothetical protein